jgi:hypothetical protein
MLPELLACDFCCVYFAAPAGAEPVSARPAVASTARSHRLEGNERDLRVDWVSILLPPEVVDCPPDCVVWLSDPDAVESRRLGISVVRIAWTGVAVRASG